MNTIERIERSDLRELYSKGWITHDGMWFYHCLQECGIELTNRINRNAVRSMAAIEVKRIMGVLKRLEGVEIEEINSFEDFKRFTYMAFDLVKADFMKMSIGFPRENCLRVEFENNQCFAYRGITGMGVIDQYQCGIFVRIESWFETLGLRYKVTPEVKGCMMHSFGECYREYKVDFGSSVPN
jgi:hypothetical protein